MHIKSVRNTPADETASARPGWEGTKVWWLINRDETQSKAGVLSISEFAPGSKHDVHRHPFAEQVTFVLSGSGTHLRDEGGVEQSTWQAVYIPPNEWHGFANDTNEPTTIVAFYGGVSSPKDAGFVIYEGGSASASETAAEAKLRSFPGAPLARSTVGSSSICLNLLELTPGQSIPLHRHRGTEEFVFVLSGNGTCDHLAGSHPLQPGDVVYLPPDEWHGFTSGEGEGMKVLHGYFGTSDYEHDDVEEFAG